MSKYLKEGEEIYLNGITLMGQADKSFGVLSIVTMDSYNRLSRTASFQCYIYSSELTKVSDQFNPFTIMRFVVEGDDFDKYIKLGPKQNEVDKYLFPYNRAYQFISDKGLLYEQEELNRPNENEIPVETQWINKYENYKDFIKWID